MGSTAHKPRILLVDGSSDQREMYALWLRQQGYSAVEAENAADGYRLAFELNPEIVVTAIKLRGGEDGLSLTRRIKTASRTLPVVVLSGYVFPKDSAAATAAGCDRFVHKPCLPEVLETIIADLLPRAS